MQQSDIPEKKCIFRILFTTVKIYYQLIDIHLSFFETYFSNKIA